MLWQVNKPLVFFMSSDVIASTYHHHGSKEFWKAAMNNNMSCERYVGFVKKALESGRLKESDNIDEKLKGFVAAAYDEK